MGNRTAPAFSVPEHLWRAESMRSALAARDIAQAFRLVQRETGVSQTHLGGATGLSQAQVSEIISGARRVSSIDVLTRISTGLGMPDGARMTLLLGERPQTAAMSSDKNVGSYLIERFSDVEAIYPSRSEFTSKVPPHALFDEAADIRAAGLSLNLICQQYADSRLAQIVRDGTHLRLLFLDPAGRAIRQRETEEGLTAGHLGSLTTLNLQGILRVRDRLPAEAQERIEVATYDQTIRINILLIDDIVCVAQPYLPHSRGVEAPTMMIRKRWPAAGLYPVFERTFEELWSGGRLR
ncbi:DUF5919 domain-containing protein [Actinoplanes sp. NPDC000266]